MGFRLVPKSVTLHDVERRNDRCLRDSIEFGSFHVHVKVVEDRPEFVGQMHPAPKQ